MPDRLWFDFGGDATSGRFHRLHGGIAQLAADASGRSLAGHGLGLSLPSAIPLDREMVAAVATMSRDLGGFAWYSEHLNLFITPNGTVPNAQAGLGLPVVYDEEAFTLIAAKLDVLAEALGCRVLLENGSFFTPVPDLDLTEPEFLNRLYREGRCGVLLDLHNLLVNARNGGMDPMEYIARAQPRRGRGSSPRGWRRSGWLLHGQPFDADSGGGLGDGLRHVAALPEPAGDHL